MPVGNLSASLCLSYITVNHSKINSPTFNEYVRLCAKRFCDAISVSDAPQIHYAISKLVIDKSQIKDAAMLNTIRLYLETSVIEGKVITVPEVELFRTENIYSKQYIGCIHDQIKIKLDSILRKYEEQIHCDYQSAQYKFAAGINIACKIYIDILMIQPFKSKNEYMAAIMLAYTLCRAGFPFVITLNNGTSNSDETFKRCVETAKLCPDQQFSLTELRTFVLQACLLTLSNYQAIRIDKT